MNYLIKNHYAYTKGERPRYRPRFTELEKIYDIFLPRHPHGSFEGEQT